MGKQLDVHCIPTRPVPVASCHSRAACPVRDTGAGIQERGARGLDARVRGHDVFLVLDLRNRHLETFASSEALLAHVEATAAHSPHLFALCDMSDIWLCGEPSAAVLERVAAFAPQPYSFLQGRD